MDITAEIQRFIMTAVSIFAIVNPIGGLPVFATLTEDLPPGERRKVLRLAGFVALAAVLVVGLVGKYLLDVVFHINMSEFMFAGGLLITVVSIRNVLAGLARKSSHQNGATPPDQMSALSLAVSPIGMPLLVGPGTIMTVMLAVQDYQHRFGLPGVLVAMAATLAAFVFVIAILNYAVTILNWIGPIGSLAVSRIMQIFIIALGVRFIFRGLREAFPALAS